MHACTESLIAGHIFPLIYKADTHRVRSKSDKQDILKKMEGRKIT
jgi:hypothetical protein